MLTVQTFRRVEGWNAPACAGGTRQHIFTSLLTCRARGTVESDGQLALEAPAGSADAAWLDAAGRGIIRVVGTGADEFDEWRLLSDVVPLGGGTVRATAVSLALDLANGTLVGLTDGAGVTGYDFDAIGLTPAQHLATHVLPALAAVGLTWVAAGTIEPTAPVDVTYRGESPWGAARKVAALAQSPSAATHEIRLRRTGSTGYVLDLIARIGADAPLADVRAAKNLVDGVRETVGVDMQTRVYALGAMEDGRRATMARAEWIVTAVAGAVVTLADPNDGAGPIGFDGQLAPNTVPGGTVVPGAYLRTPAGTVTAVTASSAGAQTVTVADATGLAVGARVQFRADAAGADLTWLDHPAQIAAVGIKVGTVEAGDTPGTRNVLPNPAARDWPVGDALPTGWVAVGAPAQILRGTAAPYTRIGGQSVRVVGAVDGDGILLPAGVLAPSASARYASGYGQLWVVVGQVRVELVATTPGGPVVFPMLPAVASSSFLGQWLDLGASGFDAFAAGATAIAVRVVQHGATPATFYVDAAQVTETATQWPFIEGAGGTKLWQLANVRLAENATPARTYSVALVDLARLDGATWGADCALALGGDLRLTADADAAPVTVRLVGFELVDYLNAGDTRVVIGAPQRTLAQSLGASGLRSPSGLASFVTSPTPTPGTPAAPGGSTAPAAGAIDTQPVRDAATGAWARTGWQWAEPFDAARLYGEVVTPGAAAAVLQGEFSVDDGATWLDFDAPGSTVRLPIDGAGPVLGAAVALRPECVGDVLWRVLSTDETVEVRNVALQWLRRNGAVPGQVPPPSIDPGGDPGGVLPDEPGDDPACAVVNTVDTTATYADLAAWEAAATSDNYRYAGDPAGNDLTALGRRVIGGVLSGDIDFADDEFGQDSVGTRVLVRHVIRGTWDARSSRYLLQLGGIVGAGGASIDVVLWNHALASGGVDRDRLWIRHTMQNPAFGGARATPGPLASEVFTGTDYAFYLLAEDLGNPDGDGVHDVRYAVWGGPVGGALTKWLDLTGKQSTGGVGAPPAGFSFLWARTARVTYGAFYTSAPTIGDGPTELAGGAGDEVIVRGKLLALDDCIAEFPVPSVTAVPPAPLAMPAIAVQYEKLLSFPVDTVDEDASVGATTDYNATEYWQRLRCFGGEEAQAVGLDVTASVRASGHDQWVAVDVNVPQRASATAMAGALADDLLGVIFGAVYDLEFDISDPTQWEGFDGGVGGPTATAIGPGRYRYNYKISMYPGPAASGWTGTQHFRFEWWALGDYEKDESGEQTGGVSMPATFIEHAFTVGHVRVLRRMAPEGYP